MVSTSTAMMGLTAAIGVGTLYVLLHEKKRKRKKLEQHLKVPQVAVQAVESAAVETVAV
tara:strand:+ start:55 stop:231 length:177 start_codon:yes stop_codon:yes gene_type:complete